ncbi:MAG: beta strand repeat-containing protein, partial [Planctomyces sp.]
MPLFNSHSIVRSVQQTFAAAINSVRQHQMPLRQQLAAVFTLPATTRRQFSKHRRGISAAVTAFESLESRVLLAAYAGSGTTMTLTLNSNETVTVVSTGSDTYTFTLSSGTWSGSGTTTGMSASGTTLTANATAKSTFSDFVITKASATAGTDVIFANSASTYSDNFTVTQTGTGLADIVRFNGSTSFASGSTLTVTTNTAIEFTSGAVVQSVNGNISMTANSAGTSTGTFVGLLMNSATLKCTGTGSISITAKGGATVVTVGGNEGITVNSSTISTVSGNISLTGSGGSYNGTDTNVTVAGVNLDTTTVQSTSGGNITITGTGATGAANNGDCDGVNLEQLCTVSTTGAGSISITGTSSGSGEGIDIEDNTNNQIRAGSGGLTINGTAPSGVGLHLAGSSNTWLLLDAVNGPVSITATSQTDDALDLRDARLGTDSVTNLTINATGGSVTASGDDDGIYMSNIAATITGTLSLTGTAGDSGESTEIVNSAFTAASATLTANKNITL